MRLPIEAWIIERHFKTDVNDLFSESILCFKTGAYRAALLFSYTAFLTTIKNTIVFNNKPSSIEQGRWDALIRKLRNEDKWEESLLNELFNSSNPIFLLNDNIPDQIKFWKGRRNDCAHAKENQIFYHHVEAFWAFLTSNLSKIVLDGGKDALLKKFNRHFNQLYTPKGADYTNLVQEIDSAVLKEDLTQFFDDLIHAVDGTAILWGEDCVGVFNKILETCSMTTRSELISFLQASKQAVTFLGYYPERILMFPFTAEEIRSIWNVEIYQTGIHKDTYTIIAALLRNKLIPDEQVRECLDKFYNRFNQKAYSGFHYSDSLHTALTINGFSEVILAHIRREGNSMKYFEVNYKAELFAYFFEYYPLHPDFVNFISKHSTGHYVAEWLEKEIVNILSNSPTKRKELHEIAQKNEIELPQSFQI